MRRLLDAAVLAALALACCACTDYVARRDTLTLGSGEAVHANMAQHVIDPWPRHAMSVDPYTDGERMAHAAERYRNPTTGSNLSVVPPIQAAPGNIPGVGVSPPQL